MDDATFNEILHQLVRIANSLEQLARGGKPFEPDYVVPIEQYSGYDWSSIDAEVVKSDSSGATHVRCNGALWTRRSPSNKFEPVIFYSRADGKDEAGNVRYLRLITFKSIKDADPLPEKLSSVVNGASASQVAARPGKVAEAANVAGGNGQTPKPGASEESRQMYFAEAMGRKRNLSQPAAEKIAELAGGDYDRASGWLPYFAECKARKLDFGRASKMLEEAGMDTVKALYLMRGLAEGER